VVSLGRAALPSVGPPEYCVQAAQARAAGHDPARHPVADMPVPLLAKAEPDSLGWANPHSPPSSRMTISSASPFGPPTWSFWATGPQTSSRTMDEALRMAAAWPFIGEISPRMT
jgi:hypothetical protein